MSKAVGQIVATAGPVAVAVIGAPGWALAIGTIIVAAGAGVALAAAGYGIYRYLAAAKGTAPLADLGEKVNTMWEYMGPNNEILGPVAFQHILAMAASGEIKPSTKIREMGKSEWAEAKKAA